MENQLSNRDQAILNQVVRLHYRTGQPVGSGLIHRTKTVTVSPATIRHILAHLEERGFLEQPHTSAGRLPTDSGYRQFLNYEVFHAGPLNSLEKKGFETWLERAKSGKDFLDLVTLYLHKKTNALSFYFVLNPNISRIDQIVIQRVNPRFIHVHIITKSGHVCSKEFSIPESEWNYVVIQAIQSVLQQECKGKFLREAHSELQKKSRSHQLQFDLNLQKAARLFAEMDQLQELNYNFMGMSHLQPVEEYNRESLAAILGLLDNPNILNGLVQKIMSKPTKILFWIGQEHNLANLNNFTLGMALIPNTEFSYGGVGILAPRRLAYQYIHQLLKVAQNKGDQFLEI